MAARERGTQRLAGRVVHVTLLASASLIGLRQGAIALDPSCPLDSPCTLTLPRRALIEGWIATEPVERYKVFVHLYAPSGRLAAQTASEPGATLRPTHTWSPGEQVIDRYGVMIPPETPSGDYVLAVGLYPIDDPLSRLPVSLDGVLVGDRLDLTPIIVIP